MKIIPNNEVKTFKPFALLFESEFEVKLIIKAIDANLKYNHNNDFSEDLCNIHNLLVDQLKK